MQHLYSSLWNQVPLSNCLRNTSTWDNIEAFLAEYQLITDRVMLKKLTRIETVYAGEPAWPLGDYTIYRLAGKSLSQPINELLPRVAFSKWFYGLFFRLALPFNLDVDRKYMGSIYSHLTLTIMFRLIAHLRLLGYPSHWLSESLIAIIENNTTSTSHPPRSSPSIISQVRKEHPLKKLSTSPF